MLLFHDQKNLSNLFKQKSPIKTSSVQLMKTLLIVKHLMMNKTKHMSASLLQF